MGGSTGSLSYNDSVKNKKETRKSEGSITMGNIDKGKFSFKHHFIDTGLPSDKHYAQTALADIDGDGVPEFILGEQFGTIYWYDYETPGKWSRHILGFDSPSDVGAVAADIDGDGWMDFVTGGAWYRNSRDPKNKAFERFVFDPELERVHDVVAADIDGDGKLEFITMSDQNNLRWYKVPENPEALWERHDIGTSVHAGVSAGDLDGDGDIDIVRSDSWFENVRGDGTEWIEHKIGHFGGASGWEENATLSFVCDINGDGKMDIVIAEAEIKGARIYWMENLDGKGLTWKKHTLPQNDSDDRGAYHTLCVADFDGDGDYDIFSCEMEGVPGDRQPRFFIWENVDGKGECFVEHEILNAGLGGHMALAGDITGNGKLDICSKLWSPRPDNANNGGMHVDFLENVSSLK
jgi:hypothetical protein